LPFRLILLPPFRMRNWLAILLFVRPPMQALPRNRGQPVQVIHPKAALRRLEKVLPGPALRAEEEPVQGAVTPPAQAQEIALM